MSLFPKFPGLEKKGKCSLSFTKTRIILNWSGKTMSTHCQWRPVLLVRSGGMPYLFSPPHPPPPPMATLWLSDAIVPFFFSRRPVNHTQPPPKNQTVSQTNAHFKCTCQIYIINVYTIYTNINQKTPNINFQRFWTFNIALVKNKYLKMHAQL